MEDIYEYIKKPLEERRKHLKLDEECICRGGHSMYQKGLLAHLLDTTVPKGHKILVCHACHNGKCDNPNHIYWGTPTDNYNDYLANGGLTIAEKMRRKYSDEEISIINHKGGRKGWSKGGKGNKNKPKTDKHKQKISESVKKNWENKRAQVVQR